MKKFLLVLGILLVLFVAGCTGQKVLEGSEKERVLDYAGEITENILQGMNENDYPRFSRDFSLQMKQALDEESFGQTRDAIISTIGIYKSKNAYQVLEIGEFVKVVYKADFEFESGVLVTVTFMKDDESHMVQGLFFSSPKLRGL